MRLTKPVCYLSRELTWDPTGLQSNGQHTQFSGRRIPYNHHIPAWNDAISVELAAIAVERRRGTTLCSSRRIREDRSRWVSSAAVRQSHVAQVSSPPQSRNAPHMDHLAWARWLYRLEPLLCLETASCGGRGEVRREVWELAEQSCRHRVWWGWCGEWRRKIRGRGTSITGMVWRAPRAQGEYTDNCGAVEQRCPPSQSAALHVSNGGYLDLTYLTYSMSLPCFPTDILYKMNFNPPYSRQENSD